MGSAPQSGLVYDHYRLLEKLGQGGMGVVWLAEDTRLGRKVALKFLPEDAAQDPIRRQRFEQEARAAAALSHPGIAAVYELEESQGEYFIVLEYVPGRTLRELVAAGGVARAELLDIAVDVAEALAAAHAAGVVHRDLKPENVMRTPDESCKVLDFGLARVTLPDDTGATASVLTNPGLVVGTIGYMSPEQLEGREVDSRSDLFSFGTLIYELATGVHPFRASSSAASIAAIMTLDPKPITEHTHLHPPELDRIVRKCLRKQRDERYQSTRDLAVDLRELKRESSGERPALSTQSAAAEPARAGRIWWWAHQLATMFFTAPLIIWLAANSFPVMPQSARQALFYLVVFSVCLHWTVRFSLLSMVLGNPGEAAAAVRRMGRWIQWTGWPIVAGLLASAGTLVAMHEIVRSSLFAGLTVGGISCLLFLDPSVARAAFPGSMQPNPVRTGGSRNPVRVWWWCHNIYMSAVVTPLVLYVSWTASQMIAQSWSKAVFLVVAVASGLELGLRVTLLLFVGFGLPRTSVHRVEVRRWVQRVLCALSCLGLFALAAGMFADHVGWSAFLAALGALGFASTWVVELVIEQGAFPPAD